MRLFTSMYATLVPTAREGEAEETAAWEYGEDAKGLPRELARAGITMSVFSDALFAVADNVGCGGAEQRVNFKLSIGLFYLCEHGTAACRRGAFQNIRFKAP